jgi:hypothetical protein
MTTIMTTTGPQVRGPIAVIGDGIGVLYRLLE